MRPKPKADLTRNAPNPFDASLMAKIVACTISEDEEAEEILRLLEERGVRLVRIPTEPEK